MKFQKNQIVSSGGKDFRILDLLGAGGQGEVYLAECEGQKYAIKVYIENPSADFCYNLKNNIEKGSPSQSFLWPRVLVESDEYFGYVVDLRPQNYVSFVSYLTVKNKFRDQSTLLRWCIELCLSFKKLHEKGYSYQDLNDGSFFLAVTGMLTAVVTAFCGPIAFIGLAVPHIARLLLNSNNHKVLLPGTLLTGASVALVCNSVCQLPGESGLLPLGAVTPLIGAPVIIYVVLRNRNAG